MKICSTCKLSKPLDAYHRASKAPLGLDYRCKLCKNSTYKSSKATVRDRAFHRRYGITLTDYNNMLAEQHNCCAICSEHRLETDAHLAVDHCHSTGNVRGLLCNNCNNGLGRFKDNTEVLANSISYLNKHKKDV